ncbi:MAG: Hpt domain-containing protein [Bdellovibrionales bacterium]|nr:Hpt domain-containing protein [Bdellovibrionales bacterium]
MDFNEMMSQLRKEYLTSLPEKISELKADLDSKNVEKLKEDFHKLKGTGKTYGIPEVSQLAEAVEKIYFHKPDNALKATEEALGLLKDIYELRSQEKSMDLATQRAYLRLIGLNS